MARNRGKGVLVCCRCCGRDTRSRDKVCWQCRQQVPFSEEKGRHGLRWGHFSDSPIDDGPEEEDRLPSDADYHGDTWRDDV